MKKLNKEAIYKRLFVIREKAFSFIYEAESLFNRVILLSCVILFLIWFNLGHIVNLLVNENKIKQNIIDELSEATGKKAQIDGAVTFESEPEPIAVINKAKILNAPGGLTDQDFFDAEIIKTKPKIFDAIVGRTDFNNIYFENVRINVDSSNESEKTFDIISSIFSKKSKFYNKKIIFKNLEVNIYKKNILNEQNPIIKKYSFPELEFSPKSTLNNSFQIKGSLDSKKFQEAYFFDIIIKDGFNTESPFQGKIYSTNSDLKLSGTINTKDKLNFNGKLEGKLGGFSKKLFSMLGFSENFLESIKDTDQSNISASFLFDGNRFNINDFTSNGNIISFVLNEKTQLGAATNSILDINVTKFDYAQMFKSRVEILSEKKVQKVERDFKKRLEDYFLFAITDDVNFSFSMNIPKIDFFHEKSGSLYIRAALKDNQIKINSFKAKLPGNSALSFVGIAEINKTEKKLKGVSRIILTGDSLDELSLALNGIETKEPRFGQFYFDARGFMYDQNIHFRDIVAKINDDKMAGQMLIDYSKELKASAAFTFTSLNIDKYLVQNKDMQNITKEENVLASKFDFLRLIDSIFDQLDVSLEAANLVKAGEKYTDVSIFAQISPGLTEVRNIYFNSDLLGEVSGKAHLDLTDFQPKLDVDLKIDKYDTDLLIYGDVTDKNDAYNFNGKWSNEKISFEKLGNFVGKMSLHIGEMRIFHFLLKDFVITSHTEESKFIIEDCRLNAFGNKIDFKGSLSTDYPAFNLSFVSSDLDAKQFLSDTLNLDQVSSTFNMSGVLSSTGYSIEQLIQNLTGKFSIATKGFKVSSFDFGAVGRALPIAKRREYIKLVSDELLNKGETQFSFFTGAFYIDEGIISFDNLNFTGPNISKGLVSGTVNLPKWQLNIDSDFMVNTTDKVDFELKGKTSGTLPAIQTDWDNSGMIKFWEDKFYSNR